MSQELMIKILAIAIEIISIGVCYNFAKQKNQNVHKAIACGLLFNAFAVLWYAFSDDIPTVNDDDDKLTE